LIEEGDYSGAVKCCKMALELAPRSKKLKKLLDEASQLLGQANDKSEAEKLKALGDNEMEMGNFEDAVEAYEAALRLDPDNKVIQNLRDEAAKRAKAKELIKLGKEELKEKKYAMAVQTFADARKLDPKSKKLKKLYEESLAKCQEQEEAQSLVKEGIELFNADQFQEARDKFEDACDKDPENEDAEAWLAKAKAALKPKRRERSHTVVAVQKDEVVTEEKLEMIKEAAQETAKAAFVDLGLAPAHHEDPEAHAAAFRLDGGAPTISYMKFINWFKKQMKLGTSRNRISDSTLQNTMYLWQQYDTSGQGVTAEKLGAVMQGMIEKGLVQMTLGGAIVGAGWSE